MRDRAYCKKTSLPGIRVLIIGVIMALTMASASLAMEEGRASYTAQAVCAFRAIGAYNPDAKVRNPDHLAEKMLDAEFWNTSSLKFYFEEAKEGNAASSLPTLHWITARTLHIDQALKQAVKDGAQQVVILGAGFDSRAYRLRSALPEATFFEVDFPATLDAKLKQLREILGALPPWVRYAPIDFNKQTLGDVLKKAGYRTDLETFFIWEGVTMYLDEAAVKSTLGFIANNCAPGSHVFFDYMYQPVIEGDYRYPHSRRLAERVKFVGEPYTFGLQPYGAEAFLRQCGLSLISDLGPKEFTSAYLMGSDGKPIGEPLTFLNLVLAEVPRERKRHPGESRDVE